MTKSSKYPDLQFISFYLDERMYGFDIKIVKEVNPNASIALVPLSSHTIRGLVNIRGQVILVMDIAVIFGAAPRPVTEQSRLVMLKTTQEMRNLSNAGSDEPDTQKFSDKTIGFLVDSIGDVVTISESIIEPAPPHLADRALPFIKGVANLDGEIMVILKAEALIHAY